MKKLHCILIIGLLAWNRLAAQLPDGIANTQDPKDQPPSPAASLKAITVPEGFRVSLFAAEPDVAQPIAINYDDRGRLWVAESFSYIEWQRTGRDRILIFEDTDKDGRFDKRCVFWDRGNHVSGFQIGHGGVWICDAPNLIFIPDADRDDVPDSEPRVVLDGWSTDAEHNFFNGLTWGPDGWLYGRHGIKKPSLVGQPGTPKEKRVALSCAIWRYHPVRKTFEVYADGTINPWGLDWNEDGQAFITTSVIDHLWHLVAGARFARWAGRGTASLNPHSYDLMRPASDHRHWIGGQTERKQMGVHDHAGGGHSHCGLMIYQADAWPKRYRGRAFFSNVLGQRLNMDHLSRKLSGYAASHGKDFLHSGSEWFRAVDLKQGPAGEMMVAEWTDLGECHDRDGVHRTSGRIYQVQHGNRAAAPDFDVAAMSTSQLLELLRHENVWWRRHALRNLHERAAAGERISKTQTRQLLQIAHAGPAHDAVIAVQALHAFAPRNSSWSRAVYERALEGASATDREAVRAQIIALRFTSIAPTLTDIEWLEKQIPRETSALVHLWMAAALQRVPVEHRWGSATRLAQIDFASTDHNLSLMRWYGFEPLVASNPGRALSIALSTAHHPWLSQAIARRAVSAEALDTTLSVLRRRSSSPGTAAVLKGLLLALPARAQMPKDWPVLYRQLRQHADESVRRSAFRLAHRFGDATAEKEMLARVIESSAPLKERLELMQLLVSSRSKQLGERITGLVSDPDLDTQAIRALAVYPRDDSARKLLSLFAASEGDSDRRAVILETLVSRTGFADALVEAFLAGKVKRDALPAYIARQLAGVSSKGSVFAKRWGLNAADVREKEKLLRKWKQRLSEDYLAGAVPAEGRRVYQRICASCHRLYGEGAEIGPDLTGSNRANLDYFLINVLFPSEDVSNAYRLVNLTLADGRTLSGNIAEENAQVLTLRQIGQTQRIDVADIVKRAVSRMSLMPQGLLDALSREDVRDLVGYLRTTEPLTQEP